MKVNEKVRIFGANVVLVPYREQHVPRYHEWMKSAELQLLTASEPLSLEEEYKMQKKWREDGDKCTFIVLNKEVYDRNADGIEAMIGDTNLFFNDPDFPTKAEAEIMIAETRNRGKKFGFEAMILMLRYGMESLKVSKYEVKINLGNAKSIKMFEKLKFREVSRSEIFEEVTLTAEANPEWKNWITSQAQHYSIDENYD